GRQMGARPAQLGAAADLLRRRAGALRHAQGGGGEAGRPLRRQGLPRPGAVLRRPAGALRTPADPGRADPLTTLRQVDPATHEGRRHQDGALFPLPAGESGRAPAAPAAGAQPRRSTAIGANGCAATGSGRRVPPPVSRRDPGPVWRTYRTGLSTRSWKSKLKSVSSEAASIRASRTLPSASRWKVTKASPLSVRSRH